MTQRLLGDILWIMGASGVFATLSYTHWRQRLEGLSWRFLLRTPRFLFPLCLSSSIFCAGVALRGRVGVHGVAWYETLVWVVLAVLFAWQSIAYYLAGDTDGWTTSTEGMSRP